MSCSKSPRYVFRPSLFAVLNTDSRGSQKTAIPLNLSASWGRLNRLFQEIVTSGQLAKSPLHRCLIRFKALDITNFPSKSSVFVAKDCKSEEFVNFRSSRRVQQERVFSRGLLIGILLTLRVTAIDLKCV